MAIVDNTEQAPIQSPPVEAPRVPVASEPVQVAQSTVKDPEALLRAYEAKSEELRELKAFKQQQLQKEQEAEAKRLEEAGKYQEALTLKIQEATTPLSASLEAERKRAEKIAKEKEELVQKYQQLEQSVKSEKLKNGLSQVFLSSDIKGDPVAVDLFWTAYGNTFVLGEDGKPLSKDGTPALDYLKGLQQDPAAKRFFLADVPEGTGTTPQSGQGRGSKSGVTVLTTAEQMRSKDPDILKKIISGEVIIKD